MYDVATMSQPHPLSNSPSEIQIRSWTRINLKYSGLLFIKCNRHPYLPTIFFPFLFPSDIHITYLSVLDTMNTFVLLHALWFTRLALGCFSNVPRCCLEHSSSGWNVSRVIDSQGYGVFEVTAWLSRSPTFEVTAVWRLLALKVTALSSKFFRSNAEV